MDEPEAPKKEDRRQVLIAQLEPYAPTGFMSLETFAAVFRVRDSVARRNLRRIEVRLGRERRYHLSDLADVLLGAA